MPATGFDFAFDLDFDFLFLGGWWSGVVVPDLASSLFEEARSGSGGRVVLKNAAAGAAYFSASVVGYYLDGASDSVFLPATPRRLDTVTIGAKRSVTLAVAGRNGIPAAGTTAVAVNLTASGASASGTLMAYADGTARPAPMNLSYAPGAAIANAAIVAVGKDGAIRL